LLHADQWKVRANDQRELERLRAVGAERGRRRRQNVQFAIATLEIVVILLVLLYAVTA
jgi:hypothetical protein